MTRRQPQRWAAFLRGVNVGPHRRISSAELRDAFVAAGFDDVSTFRSSGNVAFSSSLSKRSAIRDAAERSLRDATGHDVTVFVASEAELRDLVDRYPFTPAGPKGKPQVIFLTAAPSATVRSRIEALATERDLLAVHGSAVCWRPAAGVLDSDLGFDTLGALAGPTTTRTLATVEQLLAKHVTRAT